MRLGTHLVHWPGKDALMCAEHADQAVRIAQAMGFQLSVALWVGELTVCKNCEHEAEKHAQRGTGESVPGTE